MIMIHDLLHNVVDRAACRWLILTSLFLLGPVSLVAHGTLIRTAPAADSKVAERPGEIRLWFNESIEHRFSRITVHRAKRDATTGKLQPQERVDEGLVTGPRVTRELAVTLPATLPPGLYLVQWQVLSIDSHRTTGQFTLTYDPPAGRAHPSR
jgi:methionine-rich copper-binding protein CopC